MMKYDKLRPINFESAVAVLFGSERVQLSCPLSDIMHYRQPSIKTKINLSLRLFAQDDF